MQWLPDARSSRTTAVLLAVIAVIVVYLIFFHWFVADHVALAEQVEERREHLGRLQAVADQREALEAVLRDVRSQRQDEGLFLPGTDFNEAAAGLSARLGDLVGRLGGEDCQIVSRQPVRARAQERFERVTVNVRMRCDSEDVLAIFHELETEIPMVMVDDLNITRPRLRRRVRGRVVETTGPLDLRFDMYGYLGTP